MPLSAHVQSQFHAHTQSSVSIALIFTVINAIWAAVSQVHADTEALPDIGNTSEMDRVLLQEIADDYIYKGDVNSIDLDTIANAPGNQSPAGGAKATEAEPDVATNAIGPEAESTNDDGVAVAEPNVEPDKKIANEYGVGYEPNANSEFGDPWQTVFTSEGESNSVWALIRDSNRLPRAKHERVVFYEKQYKRESLWISKILHRGKPYLAHLAATLEQRFLPVELALLPAIESGYQPMAKSAGNAAGLWQIVPITAKEIGIQRTVWFDGRSDILRSTTAAVDYLSYLNAEFNGDWELTLAAYNAGPGRVRAAVRKNKKNGLDTDYWSLDLPTETRNYVPKLIAMINLIKQPEYGGFDVPDVPMEPAFESIDIGFRVSVDRAARIADIDEDLLRDLNAGLTHGVTPPDGPHYLLIPAGTGEQFQQAFADVDQSNAYSEPKTHEVVSGDTVSSIALKYGITQKRLLTMNALDNANIKIGQKLAVIDGRDRSDTAIEYVVSIGDTLSEIAQKFSVKMDDITQANGSPLDNDVIHPGDTLSILIGDTPSG